ncbi:MAG: hypothetical protein CMJ63_00650 [Planctomycetaceae bacterium]|jgi:hypothetical protein|nr:hypothetical protein [Planctomycetaceae bacterium]
MPAFPRWVIIVSGFVLIVLAYRVAWPWMQSATGLPGPTVVQAIHPAQAVVALLAATMVGGVIAMTISKLITGLSGLVVMGAALGWAGLSLAPMRDVLYHGSAAIVAVDGVAWCIVLLILSWIAIVLCSPVPDVHPEVDGAPSDPLRSPNGLKMLAAGVAALPVVWLVAQSDFRGQTLAATVLGGVAAGFVGRLWSPNVQPVLLPSGVMLAGTLACWVAAMLLPDAIDRAYTTGGIPNLLLPVPIDWAAGALFGSPIGFHWAGSFLKHECESAAA